MKTAFTLIELIVAIVIIGVLSAVAIPRFVGMVDNSKVSSELATASSVQTIIDAAHGDWIVSGDCQFTWGNGQQHLNGNDLNANGYPTHLDAGPGSDPLSWILQDSDFVRDNADRDRYYGPASDPSGNPVTDNTVGEPDNGDFWNYDPATGQFTLVENPE